MSARGLCRYFSSRYFSGIQGLSNYHLSCCVNSLLQALYATRELVDLLDRWDGERQDRNNVPVQLKRFFAAMQSGQPVSHQDFLYCLDRNGVHLNTQHDADEVFLFILNLVQRQIDDNSLAQQIQSLYKISLETRVQCLKCASVQTKTSFLLSLPLHVQEDHTSLEQCLLSFFEDHELRGMDCCFCAQCEAKTQSKQGVRLLSLPPVLCIQLKRYRHLGGFTKKLGYRVTFPETFDFLETANESFSADAVQTACVYSLFAVVVHSGSAGFGHYTAYVRHRENQNWYYADDSSVYKVPWNEVESSYGGERRHTAYILMYKRG